MARKDNKKLSIKIPGKKLYVPRVSFEEALAKERKSFSEEREWEQQMKDGGFALLVKKEPKIPMGGLPGAKFLHPEHVEALGKDETSPEEASYSESDAWFQ